MEWATAAAGHRYVVPCTLFGAASAGNCWTCNQSASACIDSITIDAPAVDGSTPLLAYANDFISDVSVASVWQEMVDYLLELSGGNDDAITKYVALSGEILHESTQIHSLVVSSPELVLPAQSLACLIRLMAHLAQLQWDDSAQTCRWCCTFLCCAPAHSTYLRYHHTAIRLILRLPVCSTRTVQTHTSHFSGHWCRSHRARPSRARLFRSDHTGLLPPTIFQLTHNTHNTCARTKL